MNQYGSEITARRLLKCTCMQRQAGKSFWLIICRVGQAAP